MSPGVTIAHACTGRRDHSKVAEAQALVARPSPSERSGENAARAAIEADGYKGVQELRRGDNGVWHAKALRGRTEVRLIVDARGAVTTAD